jgi:hypothetical protein
MPEYRLYRLDPDTGHVIGADEMHAPDDVSAVYEAQHRGYDIPVELWQGGRKVSQIEPMPQAAAFAR